MDYESIHRVSIFTRFPLIAMEHFYITTYLIVVHSNLIRALSEILRGLILGKVRPDVNIPELHQGLNLVRFYPVVFPAPRHGSGG